MLPSWKMHVMNKRILFISPRYWPDVGGVEKHVNLVARELQNYGDCVTIITAIERKNKITAGFNDVNVNRILLMPSSCKLIGFFYRLMSIWLFMIKNFRIIVRNDVIHLHDFQTFLWIFPFLPFINRPVFITFHGFEKYPISRLARSLRRIAETCTSGNICVGGFIEKWYGTTASCVTIGGVAASSCNSVDSIEDNCLFIGRLAEDTNIMSLVEALAILKNNYNVKIPFHIYGEGPLSIQIQSLAEREGIIIILHGVTTNPSEQIVKSKYVFASGYLSILEAMILEKPVFALYDNPLKKDYFKSIPNVERLMFIAGSSKDLADDLFWAIKHPMEVKLLTDRAFAFAQQQTWAKVSSNYLELYRPVMDNPNSLNLHY
jgi:glycosyltransferase involved in cell wall biosynthesis